MFFLSGGFRYGLLIVNTFDVALQMIGLGESRLTFLPIIIEFMTYLGFLSSMYANVVNKIYGTDTPLATYRIILFDPHTEMFFLSGGFRHGVYERVLMWSVRLYEAFKKKTFDFIYLRLVFCTVSVPM